MKVGIIGAGPAGMTAAYVLAKHGVLVEVFEAAEKVGGLAKTIEVWNQKVDLGPHRFFSKDARVNRLWLEVVGSDYEMIDRLTRMYYKRKFFLYPIKPFDVLSKLGTVEAVLCVLSYIKGVFTIYGSSNSYEDWIVHRFGKRLYEKFFKTYSEKLWGIPCKDLDADFASQRLKKFSLKEAIKSAFFKDKKKKHKTIVDQFAYPKYGTGMVYEQMKDFVISRGGKIHCNSKVKRVIVQENRAKGLELQTGEKKYFDHVISTMPITQLIEGIDVLPQKVKNAARALTFRNSVFVYLYVSATDLFPDNWIYIHSPELKLGRVTNFHNWVPYLYEKCEGTVLCLEYWCSDQDAIWSHSDEEIVALAKKEIVSIGLVKNEQICGGCVVRVQGSYPVYQKGYKSHLKPIEEYLRTIENLSIIGRYGTFKYNNQDHSILMGLLAAENIVNGARHNVWEINTDYDSYQEASVITEIGLVKQEV